MMSHSQLSHSRSLLTRLWVSSASSEFTPVQFLPAQLFTTQLRTNERLGRILQMHANDRKDIDCVYAGDIAAAVGLKNTTTGDTLCDEKAPVILNLWNSLIL